MKKCAKCKTEKSLHYFNRASNRKDGYRSYCRDCEKALYTEYMKRPKAMELLKKRIKKYANSEKGKIVLAKYRASEARRVSDYNYFKRIYATPEGRIKINARTKTNYHIRVGNIQRQVCEICGSKKSQAHHEDYSEPLNVKFLCYKHHTEHHQ